MGEIGLALSIASGVIWLYLLGLRGQFWRCDRQLEQEELAKQGIQEPLPSVCAVIPARNEADLLPVSLRSLLNQDYPGEFQVILVDDHSTDGTAQVARQTADDLGKLDQLQVVAAAPLPAGWTGKLWAMHQGVQVAQTQNPDYILLTDADIEHDASNLRRLVTKARQEQRDLVSVMVRLRCASPWERLLIPAFVFFFQKLYPFRWVSDPSQATAAAAGGCIVIRREVLETIGGIAVIRQALIDDCALAQVVKAHNPAGVWLGLSDRTISLRPYSSLNSIWDMVARSAYTQLNYSPLLLVGTVIGMALVYLVPPLAFLYGILASNSAIALLGLLTWGLISLAYLPTIRFYRCPLILAIALPGIAFLYLLMTIDSALRHWQGRGGSWKGRVYER
ncbi:MAG: glycosyltransferase [Elainellaceae cyanobacterium]